MRFLDRKDVNKIYSILFLLFSIVLFGLNVYFGVQYQAFSLMLVSFNILCAIGSSLFYGNLKSINRGESSKFH